MGIKNSEISNLIIAYITVHYSAIFLLWLQMYSSINLALQRISSRTVHFEGDTSIEADKLIFCTGYKIDLPFLSEHLKSIILDEKTNAIKVSIERN